MTDATLNLTETDTCEFCGTSEIACQCPTTMDETDDAEYTNCDNCYASLPLADTDADGFCAACQALAIEEAATQAKEDEIAEIQDEIDEADSDLEGMMTEMQELRERIAEAKAKKKAAEKRLAGLGA